MAYSSDVAEPTVESLGLRIFSTGHEFEVWYGVQGENNIINALVLGVGATRAEAVASAVREIEAVERFLQAPPGVIPETDISAQPRPAVEPRATPFRIVSP